MSKKSVIPISVCLLIICSLSPTNLFADQVNFASAQSSSQLLQIPLGARSVGLGEAMTVAGQGIEALTWNPAGLLSGKQHQVLTDYLSLSGSINVATLGYAYNDSWWASGVWFSYANYGDIERLGLTPNGFPIRSGETFSPTSMLAVIGAAAQISKGLTVGLSGKFLYEDMIDTKWSVLSTDLGLIIDTAFSTLQAGIMVKNIGQDVNHYGPPLITQLGFVWQDGMGLVEQDHLLISMDAVLVEAQSTQLALGVEYDMFDMVTLRVGYRSSELQQANELISGISGGLSFHIQNYALHYAFTPDSIVGASHRVTLEAYFGNMESKKTYKQGKRKQRKQQRRQEKGYLLKYLK